MPTILTTSQLLTTGGDAPTCKNVVLARVVGSIVDRGAYESSIAERYIARLKAKIAEGLALRETARE